MRRMIKRLKHPVPQVPTTRQTIRRSLFDSHFERYHGSDVPRDLLPRRERRNLARAYAAKAWNERNGQSDRTPQQ